MGLALAAHRCSKQHSCPCNAVTILVMTRSLLETIRWLWLQYDATVRRSTGIHFNLVAERGSTTYFYGWTTALTLHGKRDTQAATASRLGYTATNSHNSLRSAAILCLAIYKGTYDELHRWIGKRLLHWSFTQFTPASMNIFISYLIQMMMHVTLRRQRLATLWRCSVQIVPGFLSTLRFLVATLSCVVALEPTLT